MHQFSIKIKEKSMNVVEVRNIKIGEGIPKICVPIVGITKEDIINEASTFHHIPVDIAEWRADWFEDGFDIQKVKDILSDLRAVLEEIPLLFTFRTSREGGEKSLETEAYAKLNIAVAASKLVDLIDVEVYTGDTIVKEIIEKAHTDGVKVVASNHDFKQTPDKDEIVKRLCKMQKLGADIPKIAVMPNSKKDVLTLLEATTEMSERYANGPIVTMSMGSTGVISRLSGEIFGSALTFGAARKASAPGQIGVEDLHNALNIMHKNI